MSYIFDIHLEFIVEVKYLHNNYIPCAQKEVLFLFWFVEKSFGPRTNFKPSEVDFIESVDIGSYINALESYVIPVQEYCVIHTLHFKIFQHKRKHNIYVTRNQGCQ